LLIAALAQLSGEVLAKKESTMEVTKPSDREIVLTRTFAAPRQTVFDALTQANHIVHWMKPTNMSLVTCEVDPRAGGSFRYVFQRPRGAKIEVRGTYHTVDSPRQFVYTETYDFSPLKVGVTTALVEARGEIVFKQTMVYSSKQERDDDFDGVASSAGEVYANLERYLGLSR
jgi:uncharacterized protein YndB with AHSA1/START domain